ncbi:hypothetical protein WA026_005641 [Henosepilachna vigintioctopunctata]|uniref:Uncharacterized protein n=1 Tax=Henosepilachna vigintioctopunctata TaxID=420089 RepID=A0AAW1U637_9CUCU
MKRRLAGPSKHYAAKRTSIDISTQTDTVLLSEKLAPPFVLVDKSAISRYVTEQNEERTKTRDGFRVHPINTPNNNAKLTTTNYSTFLRPITNNQYANSTFSENKSVKTPVLKKKKKTRKVKFYRPRTRVRSNEMSLIPEEQQDFRISVARDGPDHSEGEEASLEPAELNNQNETDEEQLNQINEPEFMDVPLITVENEKSFEMPNNTNENNVNLPSNINSLPVILNRVYSTKETNTTHTEYENENYADIKCDSLTINANTINVHNHFYGRGKVTS